MSRAIMSGRALGMAAALVGAAGTAHATVFTFTPQCSNNWYGECSTTPCVSGGWNSYNNWNNQHACVGGFATPGVGDSVVLPAGVIRQNGGIGVASMTTNVGTVYEWDSGNIAIGSPFNHTGTMNVNSGSKTGTGVWTNSGSWNFVDTSGWTLYFTNLSFTNNAAVTQNQMQLTDNGGTNLFTNNGSYTKNHSSQSHWNSLPLVNNNLFRAQVGTMVFNNVPITTSNANARWNTDVGAAIVFNNCSPVGSFIGDGQGYTGLNTMNLAGNLGWNISGNGMSFTGGNLNLGGFTLTNAPTGRVFVDAGSKSLVGGSVVNQGEWNFSDVSGWTMYFNNASFTNDATVTQTTMHLTDNGGANLFTNNGTYIKNHDSQSHWNNLPLVNNNLFRAQVGTMVFNSVPITTTNGGARWNTDSTGAMIFNNCSLTGSLIGTSQGTAGFNTLSLSGNLSTSISAGGLHHYNGNLNLGGFTLTNATTGRMYVESGNKSFVSGSIVNNGEWNFADPSGWTTYFQGVSFTNNATVNVMGMHITDNGGVNTFTNNGTLVKVMNSTTNWNVVSLNNQGVIRTDAGTQAFNSAPLQSSPAARWNAGAGTSMVWNSDTIAGTFKGASAGSTSFNTLSVVDDATLDFSVNGMVWQSGNLTVATGKTLHNAATGVLHIADAGSKSLLGSFVNAGYVDDAGASGWTLYFQSASLTNNGTLVKRAMHWTDNGGTNVFVNNGTFLKEDGGAVGMNSLPVSNNGLMHVVQGTLAFNNVPFTQSAAGALRVDAVLASNTNFTLPAGRLGGIGTVAVPGGGSPGLVNTGGTVAPGNSTGVLSVSGNYRQETGGTLEVELYGTTVGEGYDRLAISGTASLDGTLRLLWPVGNIPSIGDSFTILTTATNGRTGTFSSIDNTEAGYVVDIGYQPSGVVVTIIDILCDDIDFNGDGLFPDTADIDDFLTVFSGGPCSTGTCGDIDFNNDGLFPDTTDIDTLLSVFSGGGCV